MFTSGKLELYWKMRLGMVLLTVIGLAFSQSRAGHEILCSSEGHTSVCSFDSDYLISACEHNHDSSHACEFSSLPMSMPVKVQSLSGGELRLIACSRLYQSVFAHAEQKCCTFQCDSSLITSASAILNSVVLRL